MTKFLIKPNDSKVIPKIMYVKRWILLNNFEISKFPFPLKFVTWWTTYWLQVAYKKIGNFLLMGHKCKELSPPQ